MALEDLTGAAKFISSLVAGNPVSSDDRREGDDHIRGIKNVLLNTFPNVNGAVTLTDEQLNALATIVTDALLKAQNLADVPDKAAGRTNLSVYSIAQSDAIAAAELATTNAALALKAPLASPTFTGDPVAPTAANNDSDTSVANTLWVQTHTLAAVNAVYSQPTRALNTTYTNNAGKGPMHVQAVVDLTASGGTVAGLIFGATMQQWSNPDVATQRVTVHLLVQRDATYRINSGGAGATLVSWYELVN